MTILWNPLDELIKESGAERTMFGVNGYNITQQVADKFAELCNGDFFKQSLNQAINNANTATNTMIMIEHHFFMRYYDKNTNFDKHLDKFETKILDCIKEHNKNQFCLYTNPMAENDMIKFLKQYKAESPNDFKNVILNTSFFDDYNRTLDTGKEIYITLPFNELLTEINKGTIKDDENLCNYYLKHFDKQNRNEEHTMKEKIENVIMDLCPKTFSYGDGSQEPYELLDLDIYCEKYKDSALIFYNENTINKYYIKDYIKAINKEFNSTFSTATTTNSLNQTLLVVATNDECLKSAIESAMHQNFAENHQNKKNNLLKDCETLSKNFDDLDKKIKDFEKNKSILIPEAKERIPKEIMAKLDKLSQKYAENAVTRFNLENYFRQKPQIAQNILKFRQNYQTQHQHQR